MNEREKVKVASALAYALTQSTNKTEINLINQEFWHSLNRKKLITNGEVETLIRFTENIRLAYQTT